MGEEGAKPGKSREFGEGGLDYLLLKEAVRFLEGEDLEILLGAEMSEQAALRETQARGQGADGQALEPDPACKCQGFIEDQRPRSLSFAHTAILVRTFVFSNYLLHSASYWTDLPKI